MKLAARENMVPGSTLAEKLACLERLDYDGIELVPGESLDHGPSDLARVFRDSPIRAGTVAGPRGLLDADPKVRADSLALLRSRLELAATLGAAGVLVVPIFGRALIPDLSPYKTAVELEIDLLVVELKAIAAYARQAGSTVILEPLNRYETHLLNRLEQGVALCDAVGSPSIKIMADFFHMQLEEADIPASLTAAGRHLIYVHVADSNRRQPGRGHLDLRPGFAALQSIGYSGYLGLECGLVGDPEDALREGADNVRRAWAEA